MRLHYILSAFWLTLTIPTLLWWSESILWIAFMSLYANVAAHWSAAQGAKSELHQRNPADRGGCHKCTCTCDGEE